MSLLPPISLCTNSHVSYQYVQTHRRGASLPAVRAAPGVSWRGAQCTPRPAANCLRGLLKARSEMIIKIVMSSSRLFTLHNETNQLNK